MEFYLKVKKFPQKAAKMYKVLPSSFAELLALFEDSFGKNEYIVKYTDAERDEIRITNDQDLTGAYEFARESKLKALCLKLTVSNFTRKRVTPPVNEVADEPNPPLVNEPPALPPPLVPSAAPPPLLQGATARSCLQCHQPFDGYPAHIVVCSSCQAPPSRNPPPFLLPTLAMEVQSEPIYSVQAAGASVEFVWIVKNVGNIPWPQGTCLISPDGQIQSELERQVLPGENTSFQCTICMPETPGEWITQWTLITPENKQIGSMLEASFAVEGPQDVPPEQIEDLEREQFDQAADQNPQHSGKEEYELRQENIHEAPMEEPEGDFAEISNEEPNYALDPEEQSLRTPPVKEELPVELATEEQE